MFRITSFPSFDQTQKKNPFREKNMFNNIFCNDISDVIIAIVILSIAEEIIYH